MIAIICFLLATVCLILGVLQFMEKGICLNNAYILATEEERRTMNKKPHYRQSAIVLLFSFGIFALIGSYAVFRSSWMGIAAISLAIIGLIYAIGSSLKEYLEKTGIK